MATLDIRNNTSDEPIDTIIFGSSMEVKKHPIYSEILIMDDDEDTVIIGVSDIDNLIKALQKAKELWG